MEKKNSIKSSESLLSRISQSIAYINNKTALKPRIGVILGSGLGAFSKEIDIQEQIPYSDIPFFPVSDVEGHEGVLLFGSYENCQLAIMKGRVHFYEGYCMQDITYPVRVLKYLGIDTLLVSNAAGGMNPKFKVGDLMIIRDHINLMPNPLIGKHEPEFGERFPDMSQVYNPKLIQTALETAGKLNINLHTGCYIAVTGPTYETPAEYNYFRIIGGDAIGMSTVPEVIVARQMNITCFAMSVISDLGIPGKIEQLTHKFVQEKAEESEPRMAKIFKSIILKISKH